MTVHEYPPSDVSAESDNTTYDNASQHTLSQGAFTREIIETLLMVLLIFWAINSITGRFRIEGSSMQPTLHEGEYVLINRISYYLEEPKRGDIIVLHYPRDRSRDFIKRIIGLPGDEIVIRDNIVIVNGIPLMEPYINESPRYNGTWTVPPNEYFVLGDNRNNSSDSHSWSFLPHDDIAGKAWAIYWPLDNAQWAPHHSHTELLGTTTDVTYADPLQR